MKCHSSAKVGKWACDSNCISIAFDLGDQLFINIGSVS